LLADASCRQRKTLNALLVLASMVFDGIHWKMVFMKHASQPACHEWVTRERRQLLLWNRRSAALELDADRGQILHVHWRSQGRKCTWKVFALF
jgi:hypothetical protein